jgi:hypothetical protein
LFLNYHRSFKKFFPDNYPESGQGGKSKTIKEYPVEQFLLNIYPNNPYFMRSILILLLAFATIISLNGQDFSGTYESNTASGKIILLLRKNDTGSYTGSLSGNNNSIPVAGQFTNGQLKGKIGDAGSNIIFSAGMQNQVITFTMADADQNGNMNPATSQVLTFIRAGSTTPAAPQTGSAPSTVKNSGDIRINNITLTGEQIRDLVSRYGIEPKPGNYWYDSASGLFGVYGYPSYGFMYPGHNFGKLSRDASGGNTGVLASTGMGYMELHDRLLCSARFILVRQ